MMANEINRWNPFREMATMQNAFDRFFEDWRPYLNDTTTSGNMLAIDAHEDDKQYTVMTELPGVKPENINVRQDGDYLLIEANTQEENNQQDENKRWLVRERRSGHFSRRIRLPQNVDFSKAEANYHDGVLTLTLPKAANAQPRQIPVKSGNGNGANGANSTNGSSSMSNTVVGSTAGKDKNTNTVTGKAAETSTKE
jgi:HSP20 family protein